VTVLMQSNRLVPAVKAAGIDVQSALSCGEMDACVYLLDQAGAGFGYRYEWERYGPFSEALAADLVELTDEDLQGGSPDDAAAVAARRVAQLAEPAAGLSRLTWIRLLASVDFLMRFTGAPVSTGPRPAYIDANFEQPAIDAAVTRLKGFPG
jgi:hypothetical protein